MDSKMKPVSDSCWGIVYAVKGRERFMYLHKSKETLWRSNIEKMVSKRASKILRFARSLTDHRLFSVKKYVTQEDELHLTIVPRVKQGIVVDGVLQYDETPIRNGRCTIKLELLDVELVFEAFCDVTDDEDLANIGNNYRYINKLGKGGFATVYKGFMIDKEKFCAIKIDLDPNKSKLQKEFDFLKSIEHSSIVACINLIQRFEFRYLVMELAEGGNLMNKLKREGPIDEMAVKHIVKQVASAVDYLHKNDIVHRDLKPENIVLMTADSFPTAKVIDFGLSCPKSNHRELTRVAGTHRYMSPEMLHIRVYGKNTRYTEKIDCWSLGILTFYALTKSLPFTYNGEAEDYLKTINEGHMNINLDLFRRLTSIGKQFIMACLERSDRRRYSMSQLCSHDWLTWSPNAFSSNSQPQIRATGSNNDPKKVEATFL